MHYLEALSSLDVDQWRCTVLYCTVLHVDQRCSPQPAFVCGTRRGTLLQIIVFHFVGECRANNMDDTLKVKVEIGAKLNSQLYKGRFDFINSMFSRHLTVHNPLIQSFCL